MTTSTDRQRFYLTFGQRGLRDGWVELLADDYDQARRFVLDEYGQKWSSLYDSDGWDPYYFPAGCFGEVKM